MMSVGIAHLVATYLSHYAYDEFLILMKDVPFLESSVPPELDSTSMTARHICKTPDANAQLPEYAYCGDVAESLNAAPDRFYFPVVRENMCVGIVTRTRLQA